MVVFNEDLSVYATRGDAGVLLVPGRGYVFAPGDVLRLKVFEKKNCENVVLQKDTSIAQETEIAEIHLTEKDTKIGETISAPVDYWYEIELNPFTYTQTIVGYDEDGPKVFKLFPEGEDIPAYEPEEEDIPVVDTNLDGTSTRPVQNQAITREILKMAGRIDAILPDELAATLCPGIEDPTPADALKSLLPRILAQGIDYGSEIPMASPAGKLFFVEDDTADYVIAQGVSDEGVRYRKWKSGVAECWANIPYSSFVVSDVISYCTVTLPFGLRHYELETPVLQITLSTNLSVTAIVTRAAPTDGYSNTCYVDLKHSSALSTDLCAHVYIFGRWKE